VPGDDVPIPLARPLVGGEEEAAVVEVLRSGWLMQGPRVAEFERAFAVAVGARHAVAVSSGTAALHAMLVALGVGPGDDVIVPSLSFIATANSVVHAGATPIFADVEPRTYNVTAATIEAALTPKTRAIMAVHQLGMPADMRELTALAAQKKIMLVEDAACAVGATYGDVKIGAPFGRAAAFSFHPRKVLTTGEGGMVTTDDESLAARLRELRHHGLSLAAARPGEPESYGSIGWNFRMTDLQAAIGVVQLARLPAIVARRREVAAEYARLLDGVSRVTAPHEPADRRSNFQTYMIRVDGMTRDSRREILRRMNAAGVGARPGIQPAHREAPYVARKVSLPVTERLADETIVLPLHHELTAADQARVVKALADALAA
jgi:perosamine synthetase